MSAGCVFCRIAAGTAPASLVYEDEHAVAFLDLFPLVPGHALVAPRRHCDDLRDCPDDLAAHLFRVSAQVARAAHAASGADGVNVWTAAGAAAGQTVFHLHLHVLPRFTDDGFGFRLPHGSPREAARASLETMAERIRAQL